MTKPEFINKIIEVHPDFAHVLGICACFVCSKGQFSSINRLVVVGYRMNQGYLEYSTEFDHFSVRFRLFTDHLKPIAYEVEDGLRYAVLLVCYWI